jgi:hypothetical protein
LFLLIALKRVGLGTTLNLFVNYLYLSHYLVSVKQSTAFSLFKSVSYPFLDGAEQPGIRLCSFSHFATEEVERERSGHMLIQVVPLVDLVGSK